MNFEENPLKSQALRTARIGGVDVWIHWSLFVWWVLDLAANFMARPPLLFPFQTWLVGALSLFLAVLLHELGHVVLAFRVGGRADQVLLSPLGGLARCEIPHEPRADLVVSAAGPAVNLMLLLACGSACWLAGWSLLPTPVTGESFPYFQSFLQHSFLWSSFLLILNILPCLPLDGGCMARALTWERLESYAQATLLTLRLGQVAAVLGLVVGLLLMFSSLMNPEYAQSHPFLSKLGWGLVFVAVIHFQESKRIRRQALEGEEEESGVFGYDFSGGYTSLERTAARKQRPGILRSFRARLRERAQARSDREEADTRERLDDLLAKIHQQGGMDALSAEEKRFLNWASKRLRQ